MKLCRENVVMEICSLDALQCYVWLSVAEDEDFVAKEWNID